MFRSALQSTSSSLRSLAFFPPCSSKAAPSLMQRMAAASPIVQQTRGRAQLAPKRTKYRKAHKGRTALPTGGSTKGTTLQLGSFGLRVLSSTRLTAKQLQSADVAVKRKIKAVKGAECWMRVFPDVPVCVKGNETRMGKGKGAFDHWACRVPVGRVVFEVGGGGIREEIAKEALRLASAKLPVTTEFINLSTPPRLGNMVSSALALRPSLLPGETAGPSIKDGLEVGAADTGVAPEDVARVAGIEGAMEGMSIGESAPRAEA